MAEIRDFWRASNPVARLQRLGSKYDEKLRKLIIFRFVTPRSYLKGTNLMRQTVVFYTPLRSHIRVSMTLFDEHLGYNMYSHSRFSNDIMGEFFKIPSSRVRLVEISGGARCANLNFAKCWLRRDFADCLVDYFATDASFYRFGRASLR